jgi:hypothetical protein
MMLSDVFVGAAATWRRDRDVWLRVAGFFYFVPAFAVLLFAPRAEAAMPANQPADLNALAQAMLDNFYANAWWSVPFDLWQVFAGGVVLVLALDRAQPSVGSAILQALRLLPGLAIAYLLASMMTGVGLVLVIVPGLYAIGRTALAQPILVAEPRLGPIGALIAAIQRSHRRGWLLFFIMSSALLVQIFASGIANGFGELAGGKTNGAVHFVFAAIDAAIFAVCALAQNLLQVSAYRVVEATRQGI